MSVIDPLGVHVGYMVRATNMKMERWDIVGEFPEKVAAFEAVGRVMAEHDEYERAEVLAQDNQADVVPIAFMERAGQFSDRRGLPDYDEKYMEHREW